MIAHLSRALKFRGKDDKIRMAGDDAGVVRVRVSTPGPLPVRAWDVQEWIVLKVWLQRDGEEAEGGDSG